MTHAQTTYEELKQIEGVPFDKFLMEVLSSYQFLFVVVYDTEANILFANKQVARSYGFKDTNEFVGRNLHEFVDHDWLNERINIFRLAIENDEKMGLLEIFNGNRIFTRFIPLCYESEGKRVERILLIAEQIDKAMYQKLTENCNRLLTAQYNELGELDVLSVRELEVLALMGQGMRTREIAQELCRSESTIMNHRDRIGQKLKVSDRSELIMKADRAVLQIEDAHRNRVRFFQKPRDESELADED